MMACRIERREGCGTFVVSWAFLGSWVFISRMGAYLLWDDYGARGTSVVSDVDFEK